MRTTPPVLPGFIDEAKIDTLYRALSRGNTRENACAIAGISFALFKRWMAQGGFPVTDVAEEDAIDPEQAEEPYASFALVVRRAEAEAEDKAVGQIVDAGSKDWRAAAHWLAKRRKDEWGDKKESSIQIGSGGVTIVLPDNGRDQPKELPKNTIIDGEIRELNN